MATTTAKPRAGARRHSVNGHAPAKTVAKKAAVSTAKAAAPGSGSPFGALARRVAGKAAKAAVRRAAEAGSGALREAIGRSGAIAPRALQGALDRRLPIQVAVDVAVPIRFAWEQWLEFESLCEGVDLICDIERDGDRLFGTIDGPRPRDWSAQILDERPEQSFAWRSDEGSDCAGLVTFHELSERLTRIEVDLDVVPTGPAQALAFASHLAHRRAQAELRRFKARLEFISPDVYDGDGERGTE
jgi:uncharacterized membrane protein